MKIMEERSVIHSTFVIERSYAATPERVFRAFADPDKKRRWFLDGRANDVESAFQVGIAVSYLASQRTPVRVRYGSRTAHDGASDKDIFPAETDRIE